MKSKIYLSYFHFMLQGKYSGYKLLDICSGPTVYSIISASKYFSQIYLTDYALQNRKAVEKWLSRDQAAFDWSPYFKMVADFEGG